MGRQVDSEPELAREVFKALPGLFSEVELAPGLNGEVVVHPEAVRNRRRVSTVIRRIRLHGGMPHRPHLRRQQVQKIYRGTNEIMQELVSRSL